MIEYQVTQCEERPWGKWTVIQVSRSLVIKEILVKPKQRLSLQFHKHRSETWVGKRGTGIAQIGDEFYDIKPRTRLKVPQGVIHRIVNPTTAELVITEMQYGSILSESDITRLDDDYGRGRALTI